MTEPDDAPLPTLLPDLGALTLADLRARAGLLADDKAVLCGQVGRVTAPPPGRLCTSCVDELPGQRNLVDEWFAAGLLTAEQAADLGASNAPKGAA